MTQVHSRSAIPSIPTASPEARQRIAAALEATGLTPSTLRQAQGEREEIFLTENALLVLEKRYLLRDPDGKVIETPDQLFRRVARAIAEVDRLYEPKADPSADPSQAQGFGSGQAVAAVEEEFYQAMARLEFLPNSPTLMNAGTGAGTLSACFVLPLEDSMADIMKTASDIAMVQKFGGGTGVPLSSLRQKGAPISTTHGKACGPIAVLKHLSSVSTMITQGGKRDGANMAVMSIHHPDIEEFITCKHEEGTIHNYNISVGATEEFMKAVEKGGALELRSPGTGTVVKAVDARDVFQRIVAGAWRNGEPGMVFLDTMNRTQPTPHIGLIEATNPCGEQPLLPYESCNLGSINLATVLRDATEGAEVDWEKLRRLVWLAVHFLDNVIDANRYSVPEIERMTKLTRKIGLGVMGFADMLVRLGIPYDSEEGLEVGRAVMRFIQEEADAASRELAKARGPFPGFKGSRIEQRGEPPIRNACRLTVAPTGTISMIAGCSSGIEPIFALCFRKHNILEGQTLYYVDSAFEAVARAESFYTEELTGYLAEGRSFQKRTDAPQWARDVFVTAPDISPEYHVRMQAAFQEHTDAAISKTINFPNEATVEDVQRAYLLSWKLGCKGITVYRAGSREKEVLTAGTAEKRAVAVGEGGRLLPRERPAAVHGVTQRVRTGHGNMYVTVNFDEKGSPFEVFSALGKAGGCDAGQLEAISRLVSMSLRAGVDAGEIIDQLRGITCCPAWDEGVLVRSGPDAVALALERAMKEQPIPTSVGTSPVPKGGMAEQPALFPREEAKGLKQATEWSVPAKAGEPKLRVGRVEGDGRSYWGSCPNCSGLLVHQEGCLTCRECGYTKCT